MSEPWDYHKANRLLRGGATLTSVAERFGVTITTLKCRTDAVYAANRKEQINVRRRIRMGHLPQKSAVIVNRLGTGRAGQDDVAARLAEIPSDTRTLTARTFGDPLPGRSALDRRHIREVR